MKLFRNKFAFLSLLFILVLSLYLFSAKLVYAGSVLNIVDLIVINTMTISNIAVNTVLGSFEFVIGSITGINFLSNDGSCRLEKNKQFFGEIYSGRCGGSGSVFAVVPVSNGCNFQIPIKAYIPSLNESWGRYDQYGMLQCGRDSGFSEAGNNVAIYRFTLPKSAGVPAMNNWFLNQIPNQVGGGVTLINPGEYHISYGPEASVLTVGSYSNVCSGNICNFTDASVPSDSYVAYVVKILGTYFSINSDWYNAQSSGGDASSFPMCDARSNKFLNTNNQAQTIFSYPGNAVFGPYTTENCPPPPPPPPLSPPPPTINISAANPNPPYGGSTIISWTTSNADSCNISPTGWTGTSSSKSTGALYATQTYGIVCLGPGGSSSENLTVNIPSPDFYPLSSNNLIATLIKGSPGETNETTITIVPVSSFSSQVSLELESINPPLPQGSSWSFSKHNLPAALFSSGSKFKIKFSSSLNASQAYSAVIKATSGSLVRTTTVMINADVKNPKWKEI